MHRMRSERLPSVCCFVNRLSRLRRAECGLQELRRARAVQSVRREVPSRSRGTIFLSSPDLNSLTLLIRLAFRSHYLLLFNAIDVCQDQERQA